MKNLLQNIRELILSARKAVVHSVDLIQVLTNFEIGRRIVEHEQGGARRAEYGKALLRDLASGLTAEFGNGFSKRNLEYMRQFYLIYQSRSIAQTASAQWLLKGQTLSAPLQKSEILSRRSDPPEKTQTLSAQIQRAISAQLSDVRRI